MQQSWGVFGKVANIIPKVGHRAFQMPLLKRSGGVLAKVKSILQNVSKMFSKLFFCTKSNKGWKNVRYTLAADHAGAVLNVRLGHVSLTCSKC